MPTIGTLIEYSTYALLLATAAAAGRRAWQYPDRPRIEVFLFIGSLALVVVLAKAGIATQLPKWLVQLTLGGLLLAHPWLLVRLVGHFRRVPLAVQIAAIAGTLGSTAILMLWSGRRPVVLNLFIVTYFVGVLGYAAMAFARQAWRTAGVTAWRLGFAAAGAWMLVAIMLMAGTALFVPQMRPVAGRLAGVLGVLMISFYYLGLASPRPLRRVWQRQELYRYLQTTAKRDPEERGRLALDDLMHAACRSTGALGALIVNRVPETRAWRVVAATDPAWRGRLIDDTDAVSAGESVARAFRNEAGAPVLAAPLGDGNEPRFGWLVALFAYGSLFPADDVELLTMLGDHATDVLDHQAILAAETERLRIAQDLQRQALEDSRQRLADILEAGTDFVTISQIEGPPSYINAAARRALGMGATESIESLFEFRLADYPEFFRTVMVPHLLGDGVWRGETAYRARDGRLVPVSQVSVAHRDASGKIEFLSSISRDISEQKQTEAALRTATDALRATEERMRFALEAAAVGVWEVNLKTGSAYWSATCEAMHGLEPGTFGRTLPAFLERIHPQDRALVQQQIEEAIRDHTDANLEYQAVWPNGTIRAVKATGRFAYDASGAPVRAAGVSVDVTEQRALEQQLRQSQKMEAVGRLAGGVAHDFNNLLSVIIGFGEIVLGDLKPDEPVREDVEEICKAGRRAADLTRQLLMFSRQQVVEPKVLDLNEVLAGMERMLARILGEDVELAFFPCETLGRVKIDPSSLEQIVMNLAVNSRDAMPTGGKLTIELANVELDDSYAATHLNAKAGDYVMLAVSDSGVGMSRETQARIFEPFFTTKEVGKGTGLGLSTVFGIVQQCAGQVWVYSEPGKGTAFKIYLPRVESEATAAALPASPAAMRGTETVLLVEDEAQVRAVALTILRRQGYQVLSAHDCAEAVAICRQHGGPIDLLLTDVVMPQMSGPELAKLLSASRPEMSVLFMSGYTEDSIVRHGVLAGELAFVQKPITSGSLGRKVRDVLDAASLVRSRV